MGDLKAELDSNTVEIEYALAKRRLIEDMISDRAREFREKFGL